MIRILDKTHLEGLTSEEAEQRLHHYGMNQLPEEHTSALLAFLRKFWGPIPWILEATLFLQLLLGKGGDGLIIVAMLVVNAVISFVYERKAQNSLAALQEQLTIQARVLRDAKWKLLQARDLVPGDIVRLRVGDLIPADVRLIDGQIGVDQSALTGESDLMELEAGNNAYAASVIRRGEGVAEVTATGAQTKFSNTAKLVQTARATDHGDAFVQRIVTYLMGFTAVLVAIVMINALVTHLAFSDALLFTLALLIAAVPVSLPVTFTLATAVGARDLAQHGVLTTRLPAIKDIAGMDVLCTDKTGTITKNELTVVATRSYNGYSRKKLLRLAALAADEATQDPIDIAIVKAARRAHLGYGKSRRLEFTPFDPATKRTEVLLRKGKKRVRVIKGAPHVISGLIPGDLDLNADVERLTAAGDRCIAIAVGRESKSLKLVGLLALQDLPRDDVATVVSHLHDLGVRVIMITGDSLVTARTIAQRVGITGSVCTTHPLEGDLESVSASYDVFARVYPEDKYKLVQALQHAGHIVGMTGDGINDAPAIRQAEVGIAVNNATDITKSAASLVLTAPGLKDMLAAVEVGRSIFQRISTYTLNKIIKTFHLGLFLTLGLILTGTLVALPTHILLVVLANDLVSMSLTTDHVQPSPKPDRWRIRPMIARGLLMASSWLVFSFVIFFFARDLLGLDADRLHTLVFLMLVCVAQANVYLIREQRYFWSSRPSRWMLLATTVDLIVVSILVIRGILMTPLQPTLVLELFGATIAFMFILDILKTRVFNRIGIN